MESAMRNIILCKYQAMHLRIYPSYPNIYYKRNETNDLILSESLPFFAVIDSNIENS
jgi:hypothetical protein